MNWLLDTNIISETRQNRQSPNIVNWLAGIPSKQLFTSVMNIAELTYGAQKLENLARRREIETWIKLVVRPLFEDRIFGVNEKVLVTWRTITRQLNISGNPSRAADLLVAAVALENNLSIAPRDFAPFVACGLPTFNPWTGERFNGA
jgi:predicted nucleic acid-binding protein